MLIVNEHNDMLSFLVGVAIVEDQRKAETSKGFIYTKLFNFKSKILALLLPLEIDKYL